jgi:hypothetical protein
VLYVRAASDDFRSLDDKDAQQALEALEALGSLRLLKLSRYFLPAKLLQHAITDSLKPLSVPLFFLVLLCAASGGMVYAFEHGRAAAGIDDDSGDADAPFDIPTAFTNMATLTTVGYVFPGFAPETASSKLVITFTSAAGLIVMAMALEIVGSNSGRWSGA